MANNKMVPVPNLTFLSTTGPTLDNVSAKEMRAHTTRANFARRRMRRVREYANQKKRGPRCESRQGNGNGQNRASIQVVGLPLPIFSLPALGRKLNREDAFFMDNLTQAMGNLHSMTSIRASDATLALMQSDWARFLPDPTMLDVSLYFARYFYAARLQQQALQFAVDAYKGRAIRSVRGHLTDGSNGLSDSLVAAILTLTVLEASVGNVAAWKIHISGLIQIITIRSRNSTNPPTYWISHALPRTTLQGLLLFTRYDSTLLPTIEKTGIFDTMFSAPAKKVAYLVLANAERVAALQHTYIQNQELTTTEVLRVRHIIKCLHAAIELNSAAYPRETFLTAIALSVKIFLEYVLFHATDTEKHFQDTAVQLMEVMQRPEQRICSSLALCASLESNFWQHMMGAIAAPDATTKAFYTSRLERMAVPLVLTSWCDTSLLLQRFFWIPSVFSNPCYEIMSEILHSPGKQ